MSSWTNGFKCGQPLVGAENMFIFQNPLSLFNLFATWIIKEIISWHEIIDELKSLSA